MPDILLSKTHDSGQLPIGSVVPLNVGGVAKHEHKGEVYLRTGKVETTPSVYPDATPQPAIVEAGPIADLNAIGDLAVMIDGKIWCRTVNTTNSPFVEHDAVTGEPTGRELQYSNRVASNYVYLICASPDGTEIYLGVYNGYTYADLYKFSIATLDYSGVLRYWLNDSARRPTSVTIDPNTGIGFGFGSISSYSTGYTYNGGAYKTLQYIDATGKRQNWSAINSGAQLFTLNNTIYAVTSNGYITEYDCTTEEGTLIPVRSWKQPIPDTINCNNDANNIMATYGGKLTHVNLQLCVGDPNPTYNGELQIPAYMKVK